MLPDDYRLQSFTKQLETASALHSDQCHYKEAYYGYIATVNNVLQYLVGSAKFRNKTDLDARPEDFHSIIALSQEALAKVEQILEQGYTQKPPKTPQQQQQQVASGKGRVENGGKDSSAAICKGEHKVSPNTTLLAHTLGSSGNKSAPLTLAAQAQSPQGGSPRRHPQRYGDALNIGGAPAIHRVSPLRSPSSSSQLQQPTVPPQAGQKHTVPPPPPLGSGRGGLPTPAASAFVAQAPQIPTSPLLQLHRDTSHQLQLTHQRLTLLQSSLPPLSSAAASSYGASLSNLSATIKAQKSALTSLSMQIELASGGSTSARDLHPHALAYQLSLVDAAIFRRINFATDLFQHHPPQLTNPHIQTATDFFNYLTRIIEHSVLEPRDAPTRAWTVRQWCKVAARLYDLRNYSSLKALTSALSSPPVARLKATWALVPKKCTILLEAWGCLLSEQNNYAAYRDILANAHAPAVPFLGVVLYDMTYIIASHKHGSGSQASSGQTEGQQQHGGNADGSAVAAAMGGDLRIQQILQQLEYFQSAPTYEDDPAFAACPPKYMPAHLQVDAASRSPTPHNWPLQQHQQQQQQGGGGNGQYAVSEHNYAVRSSSGLDGDGAAYPEAAMAHLQLQQVLDSTSDHFESPFSPSSQMYFGASGDQRPSGIGDPAFRLVMATDGLFVLHWILSRPYLGEKAVDELSKRREPKLQQQPQAQQLHQEQLPTTQQAQQQSLFVPLSHSGPQRSPYFN